MLSSSGLVPWITTVGDFYWDYVTTSENYDYIILIVHGGVENTRWTDKYPDPIFAPKQISELLHILVGKFEKIILFNTVSMQQILYYFAILILTYL